MKKSISEIVDSAIELINNRPELSKDNREELKKWVSRYKNYDAIPTKNDVKVIDIKTALNKFVEPIKEAFKVIEAFYIEANEIINDTQLSIFDLEAT